jgi:MFS family permease
VFDVSTDDPLDAVKHLESKPRPSTQATDYPEFRWLMGAHAASTLCTRVLFFWAPFAIAQEFPNDPLYLGYLGLVQAIPALSLAIVGGYLADRFDRRNLLRWTYSLQWLCSLGMAATSWMHGGAMLIAIYTCMFWLGVARGFAEPTMPSLEARIIPRLAAVSGATWTTIVWHACAVIAPLLAGGLIEGFGRAGPFALSIACAVLSIGLVSRIAPKPHPPRQHQESVTESITAGWKFVLKRQILWNAMALDLFAVLFGGAIAMLPLFAKRVLDVGPVGLGVLSATPMLGALMCSIFCIRFPPRAFAGRVLLGCVFGFGISMIVFALSRNFYLSCASLFISGVLDGFSVVIRKSILRLYSPDHMRGRIAAVNSIFIGASNELGELESGVAAHFLGLVPSVVAGGIATLTIVVAVAWFGTELRRFDMRNLHQDEDADP